MNEAEIEGGKKPNFCTEGEFCGGKSENVNRGNKMVGE